MNQIEWCQVRLDSTQEIQVYLEIQVTHYRDLALGNLIKHLSSYFN